MAHMKQIVLSIFLFMLMSMFVIKASASDIWIDGFYYEFSNSEATVTHSHYSDVRNAYAYRGDIVIPEMVMYNGKNYRVTSIGNKAFNYCSELRSVTMPNSVTSIGVSAFYGCSNLHSIKISNNVTSIGKGAFEGCCLLYSIIIPESVISIGSYAFSGCSGLTSITIPNSVTTIEGGAFRGCYSLASVTIGSGVNTIGGLFFDHTPNKVIWLTNTPPQGYEYASGLINFVANNQYTKLKNKKIYPYISSIFEYEGIKYVPVSPSERTCDAIDCVYDSICSFLTLGKSPNYKGIEMKINNINPYVCSGDIYLNKVKWVFNGKIPQYAFSSCYGLGSIEIESNTTIIDDYAFEGCFNLQDINIGNGVLNIGNYAFSGCTSLNKISIPQNIARINDYAFMGCSNLKNLIIEEPLSMDDRHRICLDDFTLGMNTSNKNYRFDVVAGDILLFGYSYIVGSGSKGQFQVNINDSTILRLTDSEESYYMYKFNKTQSVKLDFYSTSGVWDNNEVSIYNIEVGNDYSLSLGSNGKHPIFVDCPLDTVYIGRTLLYKTTDTNGFSPFYGNKFLKSVSITNNEKNISDNEFRGCSNLKDIRMGENITSLGKRAFSGCTNLEVFFFFCKVNYIGQEAFSDCSSIKRFICHAVTPPICDTQALTDINKWNCTLSVPEESTTLYQQADQWKDFFFIDNDLTFVSKINNDIVVPTAIYDIKGCENKKVKHGLNIIRVSNGTTKKIVIR